MPFVLRRLKNKAQRNVTIDIRPYHVLRRDIGVGAGVTKVIPFPGPLPP